MSFQTEISAFFKRRKIKEKKRPTVRKYVIRKVCFSFLDMILLEAFKRKKSFKTPGPQHPPASLPGSLIFLPLKKEASRVSPLSLQGA